jgi:hypothetical protein
VKAAESAQAGPQAVPPGAAPKPESSTGG